MRCCCYPCPACLLLVKNSAPLSLDSMDSFALDKPMSAGE
jgi:hypothetical protein